MIATGFKIAQSCKNDKKPEVPNFSYYIKHPIEYMRRLKSFKLNELWIDEKDNLKLYGGT